MKTTELPSQILSYVLMTKHSRRLSQQSARQIDQRIVKQINQGLFNISQKRQDFASFINRETQRNADTNINQQYMQINRDQDHQIMQGLLVSRIQNQPVKRVRWRRKPKSVVPQQTQQSQPKQIRSPQEIQRQFIIKAKQYRKQQINAQIRKQKAALKKQQQQKQKQQQKKRQQEQMKEYLKQQKRQLLQMKLQEMYIRRVRRQEVVSVIRNKSLPSVKPQKQKMHKNSKKILRNKVQQGQEMTKQHIQKLKERLHIVSRNQYRSTQILVMPQQINRHTSVKNILTYKKKRSYRPYQNEQDYEFNQFQQQLQSIPSKIVQEQKKINKAIDYQNLNKNRVIPTPIKRKQQHQELAKGKVALQQSRQYNQTGLGDFDQQDLIKKREVGSQQVLPNIKPEDRPVFNQTSKTKNNMVNLQDQDPELHLQSSSRNKYFDQLFESYEKQDDKHEKLKNSRNSQISNSYAQSLRLQQERHENYMKAINAKLSLAKPYQ